MAAIYKDLGWKKIKEEIRKAGRMSVKIGVLSDSETKDGMNMAKLARIQEYGTTIPVTSKMRGFFGAQGYHFRKDKESIVIPERPFMRQTFDKKKTEIKEFIGSEYKKILEGKGQVITGLKKIGLKYKGFIQQEISSGNFEKNSALTLELKKPKTKPLINTGRLRGSINYELEA